MRKVPVQVPEDTFQCLCDLAREERRSTAAQALVLIERGLRGRRTTAPDAESAAIVAAMTRDTDARLPGTADGDASGFVTRGHVR